MLLGTHACIPLVTLGTIDIIRLSTNRAPLLKGWPFALVGVAGILPDVLWPHTSIHARLTSWTHTIWFLIGTFPVIWLIAKWTVRRSWRLFALFFWLAMALHIATDAISGGVSLLYPIEGVIGKYYIPWKYWIYSDIGFILVTIVLLSIRFSLLRQKKRREQSTNLA